jgi:hypothetical protein
LFGGFANRTGPRRITQNQAVELFNCHVSVASQIAKRSGYIVTEAGSVGMTSSALRGSGIFDFNVGVAARIMVVTVPNGTDGGVYFIVDPESKTGWSEALVEKIVGGEPDSDYSLTVGNDETPMFQGNDLLWILPDGTLNVHVLTSSGYLIDLGNEAKSPPKNAVDGVYMLERVWLLRGDELHWSKLLPVEIDLTPDPIAFPKTGTGGGGGLIHLSPHLGAHPVGLSVWQDQTIVVLFRDHIEEVIVDSSNPINGSRNVIESNYGCVSRMAKWALGNQIIFLDNEHNIRGLSKTITGSQKGMLSRPLSDPIKNEFPGRLNRKYAHKVRFAVLDGVLRVFYPRDAAQECSHAIDYDTATEIWVAGPHELGHKIGATMTSDIRGSEPEMFSLNGDKDTEVFKVYRWDKGLFGDDGSNIKLRPTLRAWDLGVPQAPKQPVWMRTVASGGIGASVTTRVRTNLANSFTDIETTAVVAAAPTDFPLSCPPSITDPDDFPITDAISKITESREDVDIPTTEDDDIVQLQFEEDSTKECVIESYQLAVAVGNVEKQT